MNIVIRVDASIHIGSGHVMRCLVLAKALKNQGHDVCFVSRVQPGDMVDFIMQQQFTVMTLELPLTPLTPQNSADYDAWLQVSELDDAADTIALIDKLDVMIVDHYGINILWEQQVKKQMHCQVMAIDDLVRPHAVDFILDQTFSRHGSEYKESINAVAAVNNILTTPKILTGCQFALLAPRFAALRSQAACKRLNTYEPKVLISMGGIDTPNASLQALQCLERLPIKPVVTVLLSKRSPHYETLRAFCQTRSEWVTHIEFTHTMPELMLEHDVSIGAPGSTSWERACLGLPSIVVPLAENQQQICTVLASVGAVLPVELDHINNELLPAYHHMLANWTQFQEVNLRLCDGLGSLRVVQHLEQLFQ